MTTKSTEIRRLAQAGVATAEIARRLGIRYQFPYGVLARDGSSVARPKQVAITRLPKPTLHVDYLLSNGFELAACWVAGEEGRVTLDKALPKLPGVYAFAIDGIVQYVGLASIGLAKRTYFYARPGATQRTSIRLNALLLEHQAAGRVVEVYVAMPPDGTWNSLPVDFCAGLELGLIRAFNLPWNKRSAG